MKKLKAYLIQWNKSEMGKCYLLEAPTVIVGRSSSVDLILSDNSVSRHHALISQHTDHFDLEDMVSSNGTFVNARKIDGRKVLAHGDIIGFGSVLFKFFIGEKGDSAFSGIGDRSQEDTLTGFLNQQFILDYLTSEKEFFKTYDRVFSVIYLDLDQFQKVNAGHGTLVGDSILREGARRIRELLGDFDVPARLESDQLLLVLPGGNRVAALVLAEHIVDRFSACPFKIRQGDQVVEISQTISAGVAEYSEKLGDISSLVELARERMLQCKVKGGNQALA